MPIDRAPWNALVDDDGSNLVGTVWNKEKIASVILDPTDAAIAAVPTPPAADPWQSITLASSDYVADGNIPCTITVGLNRYRMIDPNTIAWEFYANPVTIPINTTGFYIRNLPFTFIGTPITANAYPYTDIPGFVVLPAWISPAGLESKFNNLSVRRVDQGSYPAGAHIVVAFSLVWEGMRP